MEDLAACRGVAAPEQLARIGGRFGVRDPDVHVDQQFVPADTAGGRSASWRRWAGAVPSSPAGWMISTATWEPAGRASRSPSRTMPASRAAMACRISSPVGRPNRALTMHPTRSWSRGSGPARRPGLDCRDHAIGELDGIVEFDFAGYFQPSGFTASGNATRGSARALGIRLAQASFKVHDGG
jgi:hypothetical protein